MISALLSRMVILLFGTLYPAYASYKAIRTKNVKEYVKWMMYWIIFALFTCVETFSDMFIAWIPFYYELKIIFVLWLLSPMTKGSSYLYRKFVHPQFLKREQEIDDCIAKASDKGYTTLLTLGSKGVAFATNVVLQTAIKGQSKLVDQIKKSYSMSDINSPIVGEQRTLRDSPANSDDELDNRLLEDNRELDIRDRNNHNRHSKIKRSASSAGALHSVAERSEEEEESSVTKDQTTHYGTMRREPRTRSTRSTAYSSAEAYHYGTLPPSSQLLSTKRYYAPSNSISVLSSSSTASLYASSSTIVGQYTSYTPLYTSFYSSPYSPSYASHLPSWRTRRSTWWK